MEQLWSPWRMQYIQNGNPISGCVFCEAAKLADGMENLIVHRGQLAFVILNRYPYTSGHVMVVPFEHRSTYEDLPAGTRAEMMELLAQATTVLRKVYKPGGFNVGANLGNVAGAGIADHVHFHIVPRWAGDTNFMSTVGDVRVIPEDLADTYRRICECWD
ncbi:MAG TPA: HIT domain-containing protein [Longilinea sp.]|nr:HIT domain-containing protein [Longilinea sp.]